MCISRGLTLPQGDVNGLILHSLLENLPLMLREIYAVAVASGKFSVFSGKIWRECGGTGWGSRLGHALVRHSFRFVGLNSGEVYNAILSNLLF